MAATIASTPSGKLVLRVPASLHATLAKRAEQEGVSLNTLMVSLLAGGVGFKLEPEPPRRVRIKRPAKRPPA